MAVVDFGSPNQLFEHAGVTALGTSWTVAGTQVDAALDPDDPSNTRRIVMQDQVEIPVPHRESELLLALPVPVVLNDTSWGLLWAEAEPTSGHEGPWLPSLFTRLWASERIGEEWAAPRTILKTALGSSWETNRTIRVAPGGTGTYVMVMALEALGRQHIVFGSAADTLTSVTLPAGVAPQAASFDLDETGGVIAVAYVSESISSGSAGKLVRLRWSRESEGRPTLDTIWSPASTVARIRLHRDRSGDVHVVWSDQSDKLHHIVRRPADDAWRSSAIPQPGGVLFSWVTGIDRCGRLTLISQLMHDPSGHDFVLTRWQNGWTAPEEAFPGYSGVYLFDGVGQDGSWYVGWSGAQERRRSPTLKAWLTIP